MVDLSSFHSTVRGKQVPLSVYRHLRTLYVHGVRDGRARCQILADITDALRYHKAPAKTTTTERWGAIDL
jgi:hypothetical protein